MVKWIKPNGSEIETNANKGTLEAALELGWVPADEAKKEESKKKRGRPSKDKE